MTARPATGPAASAAPGVRTAGSRQAGITALMTGDNPVNPQPSPRPADVTITSFGYLHGTPPSGAHLTIDVRRHFRDPHANPALRHLDATDSQVYTAVLATPGVQHLILAAASAAAALLSGPVAGHVVVAVGCAGGRHRAPVIAVAVGLALTRRGIPADVVHRDIAKPVVERDMRAARSVAP